jgi:DNA polymerase I-like protein with 3'-5' exonuclease and polymerase domains
VHDEIIIDADKSEVNQIVTTIPLLMGNKTVSKYVTIDTDCEISYTNWAEKEEYNGDV